MTAADIAQSDRRAPLDRVRHRLQDRQGPLGARSPAGRPAAVEASEEQLRLGDAGHRRRARLRLLRQRRPVRLRHGRQAVWSKPMDAVQDAHRLGHAASPVVHKDASTSSTTTTSSRSSPPSTRGPARRSGAADRDERQQLDDAVRLGERARAPRSSPPAPTRCAPTTSTASCCGSSTGHVDDSAIPTPFAAHGLLYISSGYPADPLRPVYAIRPGASGDISLKQGETSNEYIAWSQPTLGAYNPSPLVLRRLLLHAARPRLPDLPRREDRQGDLSAAAHHRRTPTGFTASPWAYNGKIFALSEDGDTYVIQAGPEFKVLGKNSLDEMALATPAVASGSLFIRTASKLYRIGRADSSSR